MSAQGKSGCPSPESARTFPEVFAEELSQIRQSRLRRMPETPQPENPDDLRPQLLGLALSGGGIRSATFCLGVLQALAEQRLLRRFDYLSTVSGGGYIGGWLSAWAHRREGSIEDLLAPKSPEAGKPVEPHPVRFLRNFSNYLTPRVGPVTADTWAFIASYLTNTLLNLTVLIAALGTILLLPHALAFALRRLAASPSWTWVFLFIGSLFAINYTARNLSQFRLPAQGRFQPWSRPFLVVLSTAVPLFIAGYFATCLLWLYALDPRGRGQLRYWMVAGGFFYLLLWVIGWMARIRSDAQEVEAARVPPAESWKRRAALRVHQELLKSPSRWVVLLTAPIAGLVGGALLYALTPALGLLSPSTRYPWAVATVGVPLTVTVLQLVAVLHLGLMGRNFPDEMREWWARLGGWLMRVNLGWIIVLGITFFGPLMLKNLWHGPWGRTAALALAGGWAGSTAAALTLGRKVLAIPGWRDRMIKLALKTAPYVFVLGLMLVLSAVVHLSLARLSEASAWQQAWTLWRWTSDPHLIRNSYWEVLRQTSNANLFSYVVIAAALAAFLSWRVDVNEFSLHLRYRNRLVRCFLGASNLDRRAQPFTGFDPDDDLPLAGLRDGHPGPYLILNGALNLVAGKELAFQKRKARSFVFTPCYCGYDLFRRADDSRSTENNPPPDDLASRPVPAHRPTRLWRSVVPGSSGVTLGTAIAVSGAATSPTMGYRTLPALAFLMTIFNLRLGLWLGNPRLPGKWESHGPRFGLFRFLAELFGLTDDESNFIYVSDGGHFENLGIYELVKRRCRLIVAVDAGQDNKLAFQDLRNAIEKCRMDWGVAIDVNPEPIRALDDSGHSRASFVAGTIHYDAGTTGVLIYLKPALTKDTSFDIRNYASRHRDFPHQSTADQWFDESQFESYRTLGFQVAQVATHRIKWELRQLAR